MFGVDYDSNAHHRADYDVLITSQVLIEQFKGLSNRGITTLNDLLKANNYIEHSEKQASFLESLMGQRNHHLHDYDLFDKKSASVHIDYYLNNK